MTITLRHVHANLSGNERRFPVANVVFVHGLDNKPEEDYLCKL